MWFYLISTQMNIIRVARAWWRSKAKFYSSPSPWSTVTGPMGATIGMLQRIGWHPTSPTKWVDHNGNTWQYSWEGSLSPILQATQEAAEYAVLRVAAEHRNGDGIQSGIDLTVINQHKKYLNKNQRYQDIGLLDTGLAGGYWSKARQKEAGYIEDDNCPHGCGQAEDDYHMIWGCSTFDTCEHIDIIKSNHIRLDAFRGYRHKPCFYMRGLVPKDWTFRNGGVQERTLEIGGSDFDEIDPDGHFFLDGSGGTQSKDPRLRVCGWAWVHVGQQVTYPAWHI